MEKEIDKQKAFDVTEAQSVSQVNVSDKETNRLIAASNIRSIIVGAPSTGRYYFYTSAVCGSRKLLTKVNIGVDAERGRRAVGIGIGSELIIIIIEDEVQLLHGIGGRGRSLDRWRRARLWREEKQNNRENA